MPRCRAPVVIVCLLAAFPLVAGAQSTAPERVLSLGEVLRLAARSHPSLEAIQADLQAAQEGQGVALAGFLPKLNLEASYARTTANYAARPGQDQVTDLQQSVSNSASTYDWFNFGAFLSQPIWDFGRTLGAWRGAREGVQAARQGVLLSRLDLATAVTRAYYQVLAAQQLLQVAEFVRQSADLHVKRSKGLYEAGARPRLDLVRAEAEAQAAEAGVRQARQNVDLARSSLLTAAGVTDRFPFQAVVPEGEEFQQIPPLEEALQEAQAARPDWAQAEIAVRVAEARVTSALGQWFPVIGAGFSVTDAGTRLDRMAWNYGVGLGLTWPIFDGLANHHGHRAAKAALQAARARLRILDLVIREQVEQARTRVMEARSRLVPLEAAATAAQEALRMAEERYRAGEGNAVEVTDARRGLLEVESYRARAFLDLGLAWADLRRALGRIPEELRPAASDHASGQEAP